MNRVGIMLCVALPLAAADLFVKASEPTQPWAYHERSLGWLVLSLALLAGMLVRRPDPVASRGAGRGRPRRRASSATASRPPGTAWRCRTRSSSTASTRSVAFNLADVWALAGIFLLVLAIGIWLIRNRDLLPPPAEVRATRGAAFRRLFD